MDTSHDLSSCAEEVAPRPRRDERGAHLVEYAMIIALIVVVCVAGVAQFGESVPSSGFTSVAGAI